MNKDAGFIVFSDSQQGLIHALNDSCERSILMNEIVADAIRKKKSVIAMHFDFSNAFGSIPHELPLLRMTPLGLPSNYIDLTRNVYQESSSLSLIQITVPSAQ
jgi:hypothetical protein